VSGVFEHHSRNLRRCSTPLFRQLRDRFKRLPINARVNRHPLATLNHFGHLPCLRFIASFAANGDNSNALSFVLVFAS
jgi:hypothetical protein